jgi:uncharacterized protein YjiK
MHRFIKHIAAAAALATASLAASASIQLGNYVLSGSYAIPTLGGLGLEASAVTYARDRGSLFFVGDEGLGVVEISRTGAVLSSMAFTGWPSTSTNNDAEGLAYLGGGVLVVAEERLQDLFRFNYVAGGGVDLASADYVSIGATVGNVGIEGITVDPRSGQFFSVKQDNPAELRGWNLTFSASGGTATSNGVAFSGATSLFGLNSLSDVASLAAIDSFAGTPTADHLLVLSLDSRRLIEIDRAGNTLSSLDLAPLTAQAIEGVTVDEFGTLYLVAEESGTPNSRLLVLTPVPEPQTYALMLAGMLTLGWVARRKAADKR